jgi:hypothetical protein
MPVARRPAGPLVFCPRGGYAPGMRWTLAALALGLATLLAAPSPATVIIKLDLLQLVGRADAIFVGKTIKIYSHWSEDRRHIVTDHTFQVERGLRGTRAGQLVVVRSLGGAVDGIGMRVSGSPSFQVGDQALLFTDVRGRHRYVTGMEQGALRVSLDTVGQRVVRSHLAGLGLARRTAGGGVELIKASPATAPQLLEAMIQQVQQTIERCGRQKDRCAGSGAPTR